MRRTDSRINSLGIAAKTPAAGVRMTSHVQTEANVIPLNETSSRRLGACNGYAA
jgi:hypothetical protein